MALHTRTGKQSVLLTLAVIAASVAFLIPGESFAHAPPCNDNEILTNGGGGPWCVARATCDADETYVRESNSCVNNNLGTAVSESAQAVGDQVAEGANAFAQGTFSLLLQVVVGISYVVLNISNFLLYIAGSLFNQVMYATVFEFGANFGNSPGLVAAWGVLRDIGNIFLLFSFIFIGLATILNLHNYTMKKALPRLLIFAVLLNFSLFAAEAVIDVSNGISVAISGSSIANDECDMTGAPQGMTPREVCAKTVGLSGSIMNASGLSSALNPPWRIEDMLDLDGTLRNILLLLGLALFSTVMAVVFFAATIMIAIRAIVLLIVMATAPIGFAGMVVPFMDKIAAKWWDELIKQSLFVPVFLIIVFVGITILQHSQLAAFRNSTSNFADALADGRIDSIGILITFTLAVGFLLAALKIAKDMGTEGSKLVSKYVGGSALGLAGFLGRRTLGAAAYKMAEGIRRSKLGDSELGRALVWAPDKLGKSTFHLGGVAGKLTGLDLGHAGGAAHHGFHGIAESEKEKKVGWYGSVKDARQREIEELETQIKVLRRQGGQETKVEELEQKLHSLPHHQAQELATELKDNQAAMNRLNDELRAAQVEIRRQREAAEAGRVRLGEAQAERAAARTPTEIRAAERQIEAAEATINAAEAQMRVAQQRSLARARDREAMQRTLDSLEARLVDIHDSYAMQLARGATGFWGAVNPVMRFANLEAIERIMEYRNDPSKRSMDEFKKSLLKGISDIRDKAGAPPVVLPSVSGEGGGGGHGH